MVRAGHPLGFLFAGMATGWPGSVLIWHCAGLNMGRTGHALILTWS
jgi:hypothetical protein